MAQNIEIPVSLGLQNAQGQIDDLRKLLIDAVNPKSNAFKDITRYLDKLASQADLLKGKMGEAFKTSSSSKQFLRQYEQLMSMLEAAQDKFTNLGVNDIAFSADDTQKLTDYRNQIQQLETEIKNLQKGKVGSIFEGDTIQNADKVREAIKELKLSSENLTFNKLSNSINTELTSVDDKITKTSDKLRTLNSQIEAMSDNRLTELTTSVQAAIDRAVDPKKRTFNSQNQSQYTEALTRFYNQFENYTGKTNFKTTGNVETFLTNESNAIAQWAEKTKQQLKSAEQVLDQLEALRTKVLDKDAEYNTGAKKRERANELLSSLGLDIDPSKIEATNYIQYIGKLKEAISNALKTEFGVSSSKETDDLKQAMQAQLQTVFDDLDLNRTIDATRLKASLNSIFKNIGIDDNTVKTITSGLSDKISPETAFSSILEQIENYKNRISKEASTTEEDLNKLNEASQMLKDAQIVVGVAEGNTDASIDEKRVKIESLINSINDLIAAYNRQNGTNLKIDLTGLEDGKTQINSYIESLTKLENKQKTLSNVQMAVNRWMGFWQVLNITKSAINDMKQHIQELDTVMTSISVVTNFSQDDLWNQISRYSEIARQYGVAIKGVYEVSQIYYQQGLQQNDVMTLTTETLKMARIAGLDYATAADYMTTAIRGFKLEMSDAAHVTDVFSALAATTASSTEEIAVAISKTAASAAAVGASFEATSAMMATMIATTRESATNIGTALKSVISRYGEMTSDPSATVDSEGQEMSLNRVDTALQTVGITIHDTAGQFRDFDDVMLELMEKWDSLDSLSQRYIATLMAGNRQQSRFLALVSNVDEYKKALQTATDSAGTGELQTLKTLDSIDAKIEKMKVTIQEFYTSSGLEELYKKVLDTITNIVSAANSLPKTFKKIPAQALVVGGAVVNAVKAAISLLLIEIQAGLEQMKGNTQSTFEGLVIMAAEKGREGGHAFGESMSQEISGTTQTLGSKLSSILLRNVGAIASLVGSGLTITGFNTYGASISRSEDERAGRQTLAGGILGVAGSALTGAASGAALGSAAGPYGAIIGGVIGGLKGLVTNFATLKSGADMLNNSLARQIELSAKRLEAAKTEEAKAKGEERSLQQAYDKLTDLVAHQYDSAEAMQEYVDFMNQLGDSYPEFIDSISGSGDILISTAALEQALAAARQATAEATLAAAQAELDAATKNKASYEELYNDVTGLINGMDIQAMRFADGRALTYAQRGYDQYGQLIAAYNDRYGASIPIAQSGNHEQANLNTIQFTYADQFKQYYNDLLAENNESIINYLRTSLKSAMEAFSANHPDENLIGRLGMQSIDDLNNLQSTEDLQNVLTKVQDIASEYIDQANTLIESTGEAIQRAEISQSIQSQLNKMATESPAKKTQATTLQKYVSLMSFLFDSIPNESELEEVESKILADTDFADQLMNLDYSKFRSTKDIELGAFEAYRDKFEEQYYKVRQAATKGVNQQIISLQENLDKTKFQSLLYSQDKGLITELVPTLQSNLSQYSKLLSSGLPAVAENYYTALEEVYTTIGATLTSQQQEQIAPILRSLDLSDYSSVSSAATQLSALGGDFDKVAQQLNHAAARSAVNVGLIVQQVAEATAQTAADIETAFTNQGKAVKYSEALKGAQELLIKYSGDKTGLDWTSLYDYDEELGGYIENKRALEIRIAEAVADSKKELARAQSRLNHENKFTDLLKDSSILSQVIDQEVWSQEDTKNIFAEQVGYTGDELDRAWAEWQEIVKEWYDSADHDEVTFAEFLQKRIKETNSTIAQAAIDNVSVSQKAAKDYIRTSIDYTAIAGGTGGKNTKSQLYNALVQAGADIKFLDNQFDEYYQKLLEGKFESWNAYLTQLGLSDLSISDKKGNEMLRAQFTQYTAAYDDVLNKIPYQQLSDATKEVLTASGITAANYKPGNVQQLGVAYWNEINRLILLGAGSLEEATKSVAQAAQEAFDNSDVGKQKRLLEGYKDGFSFDELQKLGLYDEHGLKEGLDQYLELSKNGNYVAKAGQSAASVLAAMAAALEIALDTTSDLYKDTIQNSINDEIAKLDKADIDKQRVGQISALSGAKVGDHLNVSLLSSATQDRLTEAGLDISNGILTVTSEEALNNGIIALKDKLSQGHWVERHPVEAKEIESIVFALEERMNKISGLSGIIGAQVSKGAAESFALAFEGTTEKASEVMQGMGAVWDEMANAWIFDENDLDAIETYINELAAEDDGTNAEAIAGLRANLANLRDLFSQRADNSLINLIENQSSVSNEAIEAFNQYWGGELAATGKTVNDFITEDEHHRRQLDVEGLKAALEEAGNSVDELFSEVIASIAESYITNASKATSLVSQGTTSQTEKVAFEKAYADAGLTDSVNWIYDSLTHSWTISITQAKKYLQEAATKNGLDKDWITAQLKSITLDTVDFTGLISDSLKGETLEKNKKAINDWYKANNIEELNADLLITVLQTGGNAAVEALKTIKPDATSEELEAAYNAQISRLRQAQEDLRKTAGEIVSGIALEIMRVTDGFELQDLNNGNAVIIAVGDMAEAYANLYVHMRDNAQATTADLNSTFAKFLTARDQKNTDITEALSNASGMTYEALGELLTKYSETTLEEFMNAPMAHGVQLTGFGKVIVSDWNAFARELFGVEDLTSIQNTQEYVSAFKTYNDSLISMNRQAEKAIVEEVKQISSMKRGDWLNLSTLWNNLQTTINDALKDIAPEGYAGNVDLTNRPLVPAEKIKEAFADFEDDYATLYSQSFIFGEESKDNIGVLFTSLTATGEVVTDLAEYVQKLYDDAQGNLDYMSDLDSERRNLMLYGEKNTTYNKLGEKADDLHIRGAAADTIRYYIQTMQNFGAKFEDGVLKIADNANMLGVASNLRDLIEASGIEIGEGLEEIEDAIQEVLKSYSEAIRQGIEGGMSNTQVTDLRSKAKDLIGRDFEIDVTETAEGFKLTEQSAIKLYSALKSIDSLHAWETFDALRESLEATNDNFKSTTALLAHINNIRNGTYAADNTISNARKEQYETELAIAEEILAVRSTTEDDSYKFMEQDIPAAQNNPLNYWQDWSKAFDAINESTKTGRMAYTDFYNLMTEMGNLSSLMGGKGIQIGKNLEVNAQNYSDLITQAAQHLTAIAGDTELKVDLPSIDVDFSSAENMTKDIDAGIQAVADEQINMLDSLIAMLETIVAMEKLGDIAGGGEDDTKIDLGDIIPEITWDENGQPNIPEEGLQYAKDYEKFVSDLIKQCETNKDLERSLKSIKLGDYSLYELFDTKNMTAEKFASFGKDYAEGYAALLEGFRKAALSDNYDVDNIMASVQEVLAESGITNLTIDTGKSTMVIKGGVITTIDWDEEETADLLTQLVADKHAATEDEAKKAIINAQEKYQSGDGTGDLTLEELLTIHHKIKVNEDTNTPEIEIPGQGTYDQNSPDWVGALSAQQLVDLGVNEETIQIKSDEAISTEYTIGNRNDITIKSHGGITTIEGMGEFGEAIIANNREEWLKRYVENYRDGIRAYNENAPELQWKEEEILWNTLNIRVKTSSQVVDEKGAGQDISHDPEIRRQIQQAQQSLQTDISQYLTNNGNVEYTLENGMTVKISGEDIDLQADGTYDSGKLEKVFSEMLGIDQGLKDTISQGITEAFNSLKTQFDELDSEPLTEIADAISKIATAVDDLAKNKGIEDLNKELDKLDAESLKAIGEAFKTISKNLNTLAVNESWNVLTAALALIKNSLNSINEHSNVFNTIGTSISNLPIDRLNSLKDTFAEIADSLEKIDNKKAIELKITAEGLDTIVSNLQQIATLLEALTGKSINLDNENAPDLSNPGQKNSPEPELSEQKTQKEFSYENGNGPINSNLSSEIAKIQTEYEQPTNTIESPAEEVKVQTSFEQPAEGMPNLPEVEIPAIPEVKDTDVEASGTAVLTPEISGEISEEVGPFNVEYNNEINGDAPEAVGPFPTDYDINVNGSVPGAVGPFDVTYHIRTIGSPPGGSGGARGSKGTVVALPMASGNVGQAMASGSSTLMGELGPELVVSNGHYFIAGQNGAEMVNLADDAIVFNHLQTEQLLKNGMSSGRGRAITNERNAVAFATGNINGGPAMASASAALAALKQLRAMWESLKNASVSDLAGAGGGGGGGGGGDKANIIDPKAWVDTVERWYNLTQKIAELEKEITHEELLRQKLQSDFSKNGKAYFASQKRSLQSLQKQIAAQEQLNLSRQAYYDERVAALKESPLGKIYTFDDQGQLQFRKDINLNGKSSGMEFLTDLYGFDSLGKANYTNKEKYDLLKSLGFEDYMKYDSNGMEIKPEEKDGEITDEAWEAFYEKATEAFRDRMDDYADSTQSLWDEIKKGEDEVLSAQIEQNEILEEIRENQLSVEDAVLDAIIDTRQREIDTLSKEREALADSTGKYIDGITDAMNKEREMYKRQDKQDELNRKKRQLGVLQRSGGSATEIASLTAEINDSERDMYFDMQQAQIDAIQEASNLELERLDNQIEIMQNTLDYQKEMGLLWGEVYKVMEMDAQNIVNFVRGNNSEFWNTSPLRSTQDYQDFLFQADQWKSYQEDMKDEASDVSKLTNATLADIKSRDFNTYDAAMKAEFGNDYDASGKYAGIFNQVYDETGDITKASTAARKALSDDRAAAEAARREAERQAAEAVQASVAATPSGDGGGGVSSGQCSNCQIICGGACTSKCSRECSNGSSGTSANGCGSNCTSDCKNTCKQGLEPTAKKASGGYVGHGFYELGERGTETVLTAQQTRILRQNILSNRPNSLISLLKSYNEGFDDINSPLNDMVTAQDNSTTIEHVELSMNVQEITNDYDARRAGEQALTEIMKIARKTGVTSSIRR